MHEQPNCAYDPMLPVMASDDGYALDFLLVLFYEADVPFEGRDIFPTRKIRGVDQQPDLPCSWIREPTSRASWSKSSALSFSGTVIFNARAEISFVAIICRLPSASSNRT